MNIQNLTSAPGVWRPGPTGLTAPPANLDPIERAIQQEIQRRIVKSRFFRNEASRERLVTAILVEIEEKWAKSDKPYITWKAKDDRSNAFRIFRRQIAQTGRLVYCDVWKFALARAGACPGAGRSGNWFSMR